MTSYYHAQTGVIQDKKDIKKYFIALAIGVLIVVGVSLPTFAARDNASACGSAHGAFANENGNFGWLGALGGASGYHGAVGREPGATGYNNSHTNCQE